MFIILFLLFVIAFILVSCQKSKSTSQTDTIFSENPNNEAKAVDNKVDNKTIALIMKTLTNPFYIGMEKGARKAELELGINLIVRTGAQETSIEQQINIVEELISDKVDAIVIAPGHSTDLIPVLKKAQDAKIPIVNIDNRLDPEVSKSMNLTGVPFISVDNEKGAYLAAKYLSESVDSYTKAAIISGIPGSINSLQRVKGATIAFDEDNQVEIVTTKSANWKIDEGFSTMYTILREHPDIGMVYCANDMMALGAIECLEKEENDNVLVGGFDALYEAKEAIMQGKMVVTVEQHADTQGYQGILYAADLIEGKNVPDNTFISVNIINDKTLEFNN